MERIEGRQQWYTAAKDKAVKERADLGQYILMDRKRLVYMLIHTCWHVKRCESSGGLTVA